MRIDGVDVRDCGFCVGDCGGGVRVAVVGGVHGAVHADPAYEGSLAFVEAGVREDIGRFDVDCREVGGCGGAVAQGARDCTVV